MTGTEGAAGAIHGSGTEQLLLAVDTSAGSSVAVVSGERGILSLATGSDTMKHAEVIGLLIERALADARVTPTDLSAVVVGMGPGPFTGLRVGIAAARTFALGAGLDVLAVVSHDAVAQVEHDNGSTGPLLVVTDARRREVYWSLYELAAGQPGGISRVDGPGLAKPDALPHQHARTAEVSQVSAAALGLAALRLQATDPSGFATDQALYLRSPDVTMPTGVKRVTA